MCCSRTVWKVSGAYIVGGSKDLAEAQKHENVCYIEIHYYLDI